MELYKKILIAGFLIFSFLILTINFVFSFLISEPKKKEILVSHSVIEKANGVSFGGRWIAEKIKISKEKIEAENFFFTRDDLIIKTKKLIIWNNAPINEEKKKIKILKAWFSQVPWGKEVKRAPYGFPVFLNLVLSRPIKNFYVEILNPDGIKEQEKSILFEQPSDKIWVSLRVYSNSPFREILEEIGLDSIVGPPAGEYVFKIKIGEEILEKKINIS